MCTPKIVNGAYQITDSRVSLDSVVYAWRDGAFPESIQDYFPVLTLEEAYGAITFSLANQPAIDTYLREGEAKFRVRSHVALLFLFRAACFLSGLLKGMILGRGQFNSVLVIWSIPPSEFFHVPPGISTADHCHRDKPSNEEQEKGRHER